MAAANLQSQQIIATLIEIYLDQDEPLRYQNYCPGEYFWCNQPYSFVDFTGGLSSSRQIDLSNSGLTITIGNRTARVDGLRPIREQLRRRDGWRRAKFVIHQLWPEDLEAPVITERLQVLSSSIEGGRVDLVLKSPIEAINCIVPSIFLSQRICPELPQANAGRF